MTAVLSPAERQEVTPGIIADLEEHFSDTLECSLCDNPATVNTRKVCCSKHTAFCSHHFTELRARVELDLPVGIDCLRCGALFIAPQTFEDIFKAVTL